MAIYIWIDANYLTVRCGRRIASVAADIAVGVNVDGRREVLGVGDRGHPRPSQSGGTVNLTEFTIRRANDGP